MKTCPNCKELVGDDIALCFNCGWVFEDSEANAETADGYRIQKENAEREETVIQGEAEKEHTREELAALNAATILKMKQVRNRTILITLAALACLAGSVGLLRFAGAGSKTLNDYAAMIMVVNGVVGPFGMIRAYKRNAAVKSFMKGWGKLEAGELTEQDFYKKWLLEAWDYTKTNQNEIEQLIRDRQL